MANALRTSPKSAGLRTLTVAEVSAVECQEVCGWRLRRVTQGHVISPKDPWRLWQTAKERT